MLSGKALVALTMTPTLKLLFWVEELDIVTSVWLVLFASRLIDQRGLALTKRTVDAETAESAMTTRTDMTMADRIFCLEGGKKVL